MVRYHGARGHAGEGGQPLAVQRIRRPMGDIAREILPVNIEDELKQSYLDYAMSVIIGRALP